jgi:hypothetical protein
MLKTRSRKAPWIAMLIALVWSIGLSAQTLVYEKRFSLMGGVDDRLRITLTENDRVVIERPNFMTRPGRHEGSTPAGAYQRLSNELIGLAPLARTMDEDVRRRAASELIYISDPEYTRFMLVGNQRQVIEAIEATSIQPWSRQFKDDIRLVRLAELERDLLAIMDQALAGGAQ